MSIERVVVGVIVVGVVDYIVVATTAWGVHVEKGGHF